MKVLNQLNANTEQLTTKLQEVADNVAAPVSFERDTKTGRGKSVTKGKRKITVRRDGSGRVVGTT